MNNQERLKEYITPEFCLISHDETNSKFFAASEGPGLPPKGSLGSMTTTTYSGDGWN